jgi:hypothetical protein
MQPQYMLAAVTLALLACHDTMTAPPPGLPVTVTSVDTPITSATISGASDSVVALIPPYTPSPCNDNHADAGIENGVLVVTLTSRQTGPVCPLFALRMAPGTRVAVRQLPPGAYEVLIVAHLQPLSGNPSDTEITRGAVALP